MTTSRSPSRGSFVRRDLVGRGYVIAERKIGFRQALSVEEAAISVPSDQIVEPATMVNGSWTVLPFSEQMEYLHANGYQTISCASQLVDFMLHRSRVPERVFVLHFDDGWKSILAALPILERYDFKAAFWIIAGKGIGGDYLDWDDIVALSRNPRYEVYSHTMTHPWDPENNLVTWGNKAKRLVKALPTSIGSLEV